MKKIFNKKTIIIGIIVLAFIGFAFLYAWRSRPFFYHAMDGTEWKSSSDFIGHMQSLKELHNMNIEKEDYSYEYKYNTWMIIQATQKKLYDTGASDAELKKSEDASLSEMYAELRKNASE